MAGSNDPGQRPPLTLPTTPERPPRAPRERSSDPAELPVGSRLGKYRIVRALGGGGMGRIYEAVHEAIDKPVAIKVLSEELAADSRAQVRFLREAEAASKIDHPNVVTVTDYGTEGATPFIVMELLRGEDLGRRLAGNLRGLDIADVADIMLAICAGVSAAHQAGVVHRDLKPTNIFLARTRIGDTTPKVLDFGISKVENPLVTASLTDPGAVIGTTHYLAPEQIAGTRVEAATDQYALGVVLYQCLTRHRPFEGDNPHETMRLIREGKFVQPSKLRRDLPAELEASILRAMARETSDRFPTVHALGVALLPFASAKKQVFWRDYYCGEMAAQLDTGKRDSEPMEKAAEKSPVTAVLIPPAPLLATRTNDRPAAADDPATSRHRGRVWLLIAAVGAASLASLGIYRFLRHSKATPVTAVPSIQPQRAADIQPGGLPSQPNPPTPVEAVRQKPQRELPVASTGSDEARPAAASRPEQVPAAVRLEPPVLRKTGSRQRAAGRSKPASTLPPLNPGPPGQPSSVPPLTEF